MATESSSDRDPLEQLAAEFLDRHRRGEAPSPSEYAVRYPQWADQINEFFPALELMEGLKPGSADRTGSFGGQASAPPYPRLERLGEYRILREIGHGGMGVVYEAIQESLGWRVALKILPFHGRIDPVQIERFQLESRAARSPSGRLQPQRSRRFMRVSNGLLSIFRRPSSPSFKKGHTMRRRNREILVLILAACPFSPWLASDCVAATKPKIIRFGKLVDATGKVRPDAVVVVKDDRIVSVGTADSTNPPDAEVIDLSHYTGIPGLIDVHTHMTFYWDRAPGTRPWTQASERMPAVTVFLAQENARKTLEAGVTTVRDLGASEYTDIAMRDLINRGAMLGPRMFVSGYGLQVTAEPARPGFSTPRGGQADGVPEVLRRATTDRGGSRCREDVRLDRQRSGRLRTSDLHLR